jgi:hypothetical protein
MTARCGLLLQARWDWLCAERSSQLAGFESTDRSEL